MIKKIFALLIIISFILAPSPTLAAPKGIGDECDSSVDTCPSGYACVWDAASAKSLCDKAGASASFGKVEPPDALKKFISGDPAGTKGISKFLSNLVSLFYILAAIALIFMIIWGAFDWTTSGGDKEKIAAARNKIISAVIGIFLFAAAYALIRALGAFTGFEFFTPPP